MAPQRFGTFFNGSVPYFACRVNDPSVSGKRLTSSSLMHVISELCMNCVHLVNGPQKRAGFQEKAFCHQMGVKFVINIDLKEINIDCRTQLWICCFTRPPLCQD